MTVTPRRKILLIQLKRAGDVIVTTPVIEALGRRFPECEIDFLTQKPYAPLLNHHPFLRKVHLYDKSDLLGTFARIRSERYDVLVDFQSSPRSALLAFLSGARLRAGFRVPFWGMTYSRTVPRPRGSFSVTEGKFTLVEHLFGPLPDRPPRRLMLTDEEMAWAQKAMPVSPDRKIIGLAPTSLRPIRRWPMTSFAEVARDFIAKGFVVWFFWGPGEEALIDSLVQNVPGAQKIPPTTLREMAALLQRCRVVVTNTNGPMHLAVAVGTATATIYGPTDPANWEPGGERHRALQAKDVMCLGCNLSQCPFAHECMTHLTPGEVLAAAEQLMTLNR